MKETIQSIAWGVFWFVLSAGVVVFYNLDLEFIYINF